jgi:hypothetical protein
MQTYYTGQDIEDLAARGSRRLELGPGVVLTDIAREMANQLGIELVNVNAPQPTGNAAAPPRQPAARSTPLGAKPRGCQHGPIQMGSSPVGNRKASGDVVNNLVEVVSRLADQGE